MKRKPKLIYETGWMGTKKCCDGIYWAMHGNQELVCCVKLRRFLSIPKGTIRIKASLWDGEVSNDALMVRFRYRKHSTWRVLWTTSPNRVPVGKLSHWADQVLIDCLFDKGTAEDGTTKTAWLEIELED